MMVTIAMQFLVDKLVGRIMGLVEERRTQNCSSPSKIASGRISMATQDTFWCGLKSTVSGTMLKSTPPVRICSV